MTRERIKNRQRTFYTVGVRVITLDNQLRLVVKDSRQGKPVDRMRVVKVFWPPRRWPVS